MAEAIFDKLADGKATAVSAGIEPGAYEGHALKEVGPTVVRCMGELGIDVSDKVSKPITKDKADEADLVVSMVGKEKLPEYIQRSNKLVLWKVDDPKDMGYEGHVEIRDKIYKNVEQLLKQLGL
ncbi:arsenate reductase [mine drainage metagenome]|uniref:Arsenate reductase n=1 Tax=mine drainage metagenome TaxID=410659 RepID=T1AJG7_9ZZZZ